MAEGGAKVGFDRRDLRARQRSFPAFLQALHRLFLRREQRNLQSMLVVFLDELAKEWRLKKVTSETPSREQAPEKTSAPDPRSPFAESPATKTR